MDGEKIEESTTRDRVLFGQTDEECTGIVAAIYPSIDVIRTAIARNCNLIISHESLFWNHGDHTDWLMGNQTYLEKKKLLEDHHISVWRLHDYIHAGMDVHGDSLKSDTILHSDQGCHYTSHRFMNWSKVRVFANQCPEKGIAGITLHKKASLVI